MKKGLIYMLIIIIISGCSNITGEDVFLNNISTMEQSFNQEDWKNLRKQVDELKKTYKENMWKIQLLGDEGEYEGVDESINRLIVAIDEKDLTQAKLELATVKSLIEDIYSM